MDGLFQYSTETIPGTHSQRVRLLEECGDKSKSPELLFRSARKYLDWFTAPHLNRANWDAMMSNPPNQSLEEKFVKVIAQVCSDFELNFTTSEMGWNETKKTIFLLLQFYGTPKKYFPSPENTDVLGTGSICSMVGESALKPPYF